MDLFIIHKGFTIKQDDSKLNLLLPQQKSIPALFGFEGFHHILGFLF